MNNTILNICKYILFIVLSIFFLNFVYATPSPITEERVIVPAPFTPLTLNPISQSNNHQLFRNDNVLYAVFLSNQSNGNASLLVYNSSDSGATWNKRINISVNNTEIRHVTGFIDGTNFVLTGYSIKSKTIYNFYSSNWFATYINTSQEFSVGGVGYNVSHIATKLIKGVGHACFIINTSVADTQTLWVGEWVTNSWSLTSLNTPTSRNGNEKFCDIEKQSNGDDLYIVTVNGTGNLNLWSSASYPYSSWSLTAESFVNTTGTNDSEGNINFDFIAFNDSTIGPTSLNKYMVIYPSTLLPGKSGTILSNSTIDPSLWYIGDALFSQPTLLANQEISVYKEESSSRIHVFAVEYPTSTSISRIAYSYTDNYGSNWTRNNRYYSISDVDVNGKILGTNSLINPQFFMNTLSNTTEIGFLFFDNISKIVYYDSLTTNTSSFTFNQTPDFLRVIPSVISQINFPSVSFKKVLNTYFPFIRFGVSPANVNGISINYTAVFDRDVTTNLNDNFIKLNTSWLFKPYFYCNNGSDNFVGNITSIKQLATKTIEYIVNFSLWSSIGQSMLDCFDPIEPVIAPLNFTGTLVFINSSRDIYAKNWTQAVGFEGDSKNVTGKLGNNVIHLWGDYSRTKSYGAVCGVTNDNNQLFVTLINTSNSSLINHTIILDDDQSQSWKTIVCNVMYFNNSDDAIVVYEDNLGGGDVYDNGLKISSINGSKIGINTTTINWTASNMGLGFAGNIIMKQRRGGNETAIAFEINTSYVDINQNKILNGSIVLIMINKTGGLIKQFFNWSSDTNLSTHDNGIFANSRVHDIAWSYDDSSLFIVAGNQTGQFAGNVLYWVYNYTNGSVVNGPYKITNVTTGPFRPGIAVSVLNSRNDSVGYIVGHNSGTSNIFTGVISNNGTEETGSPTKGTQVAGGIRSDNVDAYMEESNGSSSPTIFTYSKTTELSWVEYYPATQRWSVSSLGNSPSSNPFGTTFIASHHIVPCPETDCFMIVAIDNNQVGFSGVFWNGSQLNTQYVQRIGNDLPGFGSSGYSNVEFLFSAVSPDLSPPTFVARSFNKSSTNFTRLNVINASANWTDIGGLNICQVIINETGIYRFFNFTMFGNNDGCSQNFTINKTRGNVVNISFRINDSLGHIAQDDNIITIQNSMPQITNVTPNQSLQLNISVSSTTSYFNLTFVTDLDEDSIKLEWIVDGIYQSTTNQNFSRLFDTAGKFNVSANLSDTISQQIIEWVVNVTFTSGLQQGGSSGGGGGGGSSPPFFTFINQTLNATIENCNFNKICESTEDPFGCPSDCKINADYLFCDDPSRRCIKDTISDAFDLLNSRNPVFRLSLLLSIGALIIILIPADSAIAKIFKQPFIKRKKR